MSKLFFWGLNILFFFIFLSSPALAQELKQVVLVNPIRGGDFWNYNYSLTETPKQQYEIIKKNKKLNFLCFAKNSYIRKNRNIYDIS